MYDTVNEAYGLETSHAKILFVSLFFCLSFFSFLPPFVLYYPSVFFSRFFLPFLIFTILKVLSLLLFLSFFLSFFNYLFLLIRIKQNPYEK